MSEKLVKKALELLNDPKENASVKKKKRKSRLVKPGSVIGELVQPVFCSN